ncbi:MAG: hypothetical protein IKU84_06160 [Clostridia bacterium]|nr:hypothetical protein [Clostridia bacterium]
MELLPVVLVLTAFLIVVYLIARGQMFKNFELFANTPPYDMENVKAKHAILKKVLLLGTFLPMILILTLKILAQRYASYELQRAVGLALSQYYIANIIGLSVLALCSGGSRHSLDFVIFDEPYILTRYMIYPKLPVSAGIITGIVYSIAGGMAGFIYSYFASDIGIHNGMDFPIGILCFVLELVLVYFVNYIIIGWYEETSNDFLFADVSEADYDKAARRYYGIWRNRLLLANLIAGAQLILGGYVTMTESGDHLMTLRIVGLAIISAFFTYVFIQGRNFENPIVVKGMVYPSEQKRVALKWATLIASALYIIAILIFA